MKRLLMAISIWVLGIATLHAETALHVLVTFSILGDFVAQVGGERVAVTSLVGPDEDAHAFDARASDIRRLSNADMVVANGLGFDPWIARMLAAARFKGTVVTASAGIAARPAADGAANAHGHEHDGDADPHAWLDVRNAMQYVRNIEAALAQRDPAGATIYAANAAAYLVRLAELDDTLRARLAALPPDRRTVVTPHDAFGYFAHAYGLRFLAPAGLSNEAAPSAAALAALIRQLRSLAVPVVYLETLSDPRLIERIRAETGARLGGTLHADALSTRDGVGTYIALMEHNLRTLTADYAR